MRVHLPVLDCDQSAIAFSGVMEIYPNESDGCWTLGCPALMLTHDGVPIPFRPADFLDDPQEPWFYEEAYGVPPEEDAA